MVNILINWNIKLMRNDDGTLEVLSSKDLMALLTSRFTENFDIAFSYLNSDPEWYYTQIEEDWMISDFEAMDCKYNWDTKTWYSEDHWKKKKKEEKELLKAQRKAEKEAEKEEKKKNKKK